ncbi:PH domain-containing protein [Paenibacillus elgii]
MKTSNSDPIVATNRLHPVSLLLFAAKTARQLVHVLPLAPLIVLLVTLFYGEQVHWIGVSFAVAGLALLLVFAFAWMRWYRFKYALKQGTLYVEHGVWIRKKIWITKERVLSIDSTARMYHRPFGVVKLEVVTAGGDEPAAEFGAIRLTEAERIREALAFSQASADSPHTGKRTALRTRISLPFDALLHYGATSGRFGIVLAAFGGIFSRLDDVGKRFDLWTLLSQRLGPLWYLWLLLLLMGVAWLIAAVITIVMDFGYRLERVDDRLIIRRGLFDKKSVTIPLKRIQAIHLVENVLRRPFGLVSIYMVTAGQHDKDTRSTVLFPLLKLSELDGFAPGFTLPEQWNGPDKTARGHFMLVPALLCALVAVPGVLWLPGHYRWLSLLLPLLALVWGQLRYSHAAWSVGDDQMAVRYGGFSLRRALIPRKRMQWYRMSQTAFQARSERATLKIAVAAGRDPALFSVKHAPQATVREFIQWISKGKVS